MNRVVGNPLAPISWALSGVHHQSSATLKYVGTPAVPMVHSRTFAVPRTRGVVCTRLWTPPPPPPPNVAICPASTHTASRPNDERREVVSALILTLSPSLHFATPLPSYLRHSKIWPPVSLPTPQRRVSTPFFFLLGGVLRGYCQIPPN